MSDFNTRVAHLFREALDVPDNARTAWLDQACTDDPQLRAATDALLARLSPSTAETDPPAPAARLLDAAREAVARNWLDRQGERIGAFRLISRLGAGGMGEVWLAERVDGGFEQLVAIKWLGVTLRADAHARFEQERAILARLDHPGIARIVDGGSLDGTPWFAMEYVAGEPLDAYIERVKPPLVLVLQLLIKVCEAVQVAHQNLIVHRDIKPSNVLIDRDGQPRLVDFGVAKLLDSAPALTQQTHAPLTYAYAAPEQISNSPITTAADVYALGVVLYELLAGVRPFQDHANNLPMMMAAQSTSDPLAPSSKLQGTVTTRWRTAALRGDLDTITLKALARDPARRYSSVQSLAEDLRRHLDGLPIQARPDSAGYRLRKLLRRHPVASALGAAAVACLLALTVLSWIQAQRADAAAANSALAAENARVEARQAEAVVVHLATVLNRAQMAGDQVSTTTLLDWAADPKLSGEYGDPAMSRALKLAVAEFLMVRHDFPRALEVLDALAPLLEQASPRERLQAATNRTRALIRLGRLEEAERSLAAASALLPAEPVERAANLQVAASELYRAQGRTEEAARAAFAVVDITEKLTDTSALSRGQNISSAATSLMQMGYLDDAVRLSERAVAIWRAGQVRDMPALATTLTIAPNALFARGHMLQAIDRYRAVIADPSAQGESPPPRAARGSGFAKALAFANQADEALATIGSARSSMCEALGNASGDCAALTLISAETAQITRRDAAVERELQAAEAILKTNPIPPYSAEIRLIRLRAAAITQPSAATVSAMIAATAPPELSASGARKALRWLLFCAQQLDANGERALALSVAQAAQTVAVKLPPELGGMDRALLEIWRARIAGEAIKPDTLEALRAAIGAEHPWVLSAVTPISR